MTPTDPTTHPPERTPPTPNAWGLYSDELKQWGAIYDSEEDAKYCKLSWQRVVRLVPAGSEAGPAWHERPTDPGWWLGHSIGVHRFADQGDIERYSENAKLWYGPIPEPETNQLQTKGG